LTWIPLLEASPRAHRPLPQICHVLYWRVVPW